MRSEVPSTVSQAVRFECYEVDLAAGELRKRGLRIHLREQSFQVLAALLEHPGQVVTREELCHRLWHGDVFVDFETNLNAIVTRLRHALRDNAEHPRFIETLPRRGYRFLLPVVHGALALPQAPASRIRILVLPFLNLTGDPGQEYFSDAMTDEIITALAALTPERLAVIALTTAMRYKRSRKDVGRIGRELQLDYLVEGSVRRTEDRVSVNIQLIQSRDQTHLFARKYDAPMRDIFRLHGCVAQAIARHVPTIADALPEGTVREHVRRTPTHNLAAYNEYNKGRYEMWKLTPETMADAKRHFEAALAHDPKFALACNSLAEFYWYLGLFGYAPSRETDRVGRSYVLRALEADSSSADSHALLSFYPAKHNCPDEIDYYNWAEIQKELAHARELDPTSRLARLRYALVQAELGHAEQGAAELERALESDPLSLDTRAWLVPMLYLSRQFDRALEQSLEILDWEPEHFLPYDLLGQVYLQMKRFEESAAAFRRSIELSPDLLMLQGWLGLALGWGGRTNQAQAVLDGLRTLSSQRYVPPTCFAWIYLGLGKMDEAFLWLERAIDAPDRMIEPLKSYPFLDPIRTDPRFSVLLRKMRLAA